MQIDIVSIGKHDLDLSQCVELARCLTDAVGHGARGDRLPVNGRGVHDLAVSLVERKAGRQAGPSLFDFQLDSIKESVRNELENRGRVKADHFYKTLVEQPTNLISTTAYREALLALESAGDLVVTAKDGSGKPVPKRRKNTLAGGSFVELTKAAEA